MENENNFKAEPRFIANQESLEILPSNGHINSKCKVCNKTFSKLANLKPTYKKNS